MDPPPQWPPFRHRSQAISPAIMSQALCPRSRLQRQVRRPRFQPCRSLLHPARLEATATTGRLFPSIPESLPVCRFPRIMGEMQPRSDPQGLLAHLDNIPERERTPKAIRHPTIRRLHRPPPTAAAQHHPHPVTGAAHHLPLTNMRQVNPRVRLHTARGHPPANRTQARLSHRDNTVSPPALLTARGPLLLLLLLRLHMAPILPHRPRGSTLHRPALVMHKLPPRRRALIRAVTRRLSLIIPIAPPITAALLMDRRRQRPRHRLPTAQAHRGLTGAALPGAIHLRHPPATPPPVRHLCQAVPPGRLAIQLGVRPRLKLRMEGPMLHRTLHPPPPKTQGTMPPRRATLTR
jgi:hypothetical protein